MLSYILITERMLRGAGLCHAVDGMSYREEATDLPCEHVFRDIYLLVVADADEGL